MCDTNGINGIGGRNNEFSTGWVGGFGPIQYGSGLSDSYHYHIPTGMFARINGANRALMETMISRLAGHSITEIGLCKDEVLQKGQVYTE